MQPVMDRLETIISLNDLNRIDEELAIAFRDGDLNSSIWNASEISALSVLETVEDSIDRFQADAIDGIIEGPLALAGQILWTAAERKFKQSTQQDLSELMEDAVFISLKAAVAFLYGANIANAYAIQRIASKWPTNEPAMSYYFTIIETLFNFPGTQAKPDSDTLTKTLVEYYSSLMSQSNLIEPLKEPKAPEILDLIATQLGKGSIRYFSAPVNSIGYSFQTVVDWLRKHLTVHLLDDYFGPNVDIGKYRLAVH